jgi:hypothetical protein
MATAPHEPDDLDVPPRLADDLRGVYRTAPAVSPEVGRTILDAAHARLRRRRWLGWTGVGAVAAAVAVFVGVAVWTSRNPSPAPNRPAVATRAEDANADGVVDIRDALRLANQIRAAGGPPATGARDVTGDGIVDRRDVDAIAMAAVRLPREDVR